VAQRALLGDLEVQGDLGQGGVAVHLQIGKDCLTPGVHEFSLDVLSTGLLKYPSAAA
jgi:hypothetical protein